MLTTIILLLGAGWFWWFLSGSYDRVLEAAKQHCALMSVQFLDGSVQRNGFGFARNKADSMVLVQRFRFEFATTGDLRYFGIVELTGSKITKIELEAHKFEEN